MWPNDDGGTVTMKPGESDDAHGPIGTYEGGGSPSPDDHPGPPNTDDPAGQTVIRFPLQEHSMMGSRVERQARLTLEGEVFLVEWDAEDEVVHIRHPKWSLGGVGETLLEAEIDLIREAQELAEVMMPMRPAELDESARALSGFALRFLTMKTG